MNDEQRAMLDWHLTGNIYPPKGHLLEVAELAIETVNAGNGEDVIATDERGMEATAWEIVEALLLESWIQDEFSEEEW